ncbi:MAG: dTDP-4-dehydrorhamnose reductase [Gammaproteobacteria bacterium RIFCSPHIGHO2_02_FULL_42_13]|nr:MAG: dTDP-4-dehydrorhamnose reductase [Gammaproteobacteria bacterium RIFCSPHIGHO2_02_FULL_42_13]OGT71147.1 MAG: dTDP-4-dehydrorhamnose reductase [Gammaproteobacteria bacterium RIFCSPLOWO2_02_FULL_42_9]
MITRNVLITGGGGQLAWDLMNSMCPFPLELTELPLEQLDITKETDVERAFATYQPHLIINTAAYTAVDKAEEEKALAFKVNRDGAGLLAKLCKQHRLPLLHLSTDYVFDGEKKFAYLENDPVNPISVYGQSKWGGEEVVRKQLHEHIILRVSGIFGVHGHNFVKTIIKLAGQRDSLDIVHDQTTCPTPAADIADALLQIANNILCSNQIINWGTYHYCSSPSVTWHDFAAVIIEEAANYQTLTVKTLNAITAKQLNLLAKRPGYSVLNCDKIFNEFGIARPNWKIGLTRVIRELFCEKLPI